MRAKYFTHNNFWHFLACMLVHDALLDIKVISYSSLILNASRSPDLQLFQGVDKKFPETRIQCCGMFSLHMIFAFTVCE